MTSFAQKISPVTAEPAASARDAHTHFSRRLAFETDCADVGGDVRSGMPPYAILDVRSEKSWTKGHVPGALNVPSSSIDENVARSLPDGLLVVYCWGPGCNGAQRAAAALSEHGRQVKEMIGGFEYWVREGLPVEGEEATQLADLAEPALVGG